MQVDYSVLYYSIPGIAIIMIAEAIDMVYSHKFTFHKKDFFSNIFIGLVAFALSFVVKGTALLIYTWVYQLRLFTLPPVWWAWVICFIADDFSYYWFHRCSHQIRFFWASHAVHHTAETFTPSVTLRLPWTSNFTGTFLFWAWMPLIGIHPAMVITMKSISILYQFWLHTEKIKTMPAWFEAVFNTPSHHRVHHSSNTEYIDKNHAGTLIIWDKLFGTYMDETTKPVYGLTKKINTANPFILAFHEWKNIFDDCKKAKNAKEKINFIFNTPDWRERQIQKIDAIET